MIREINKHQWDEISPGYLKLSKLAIYSSLSVRTLRAAIKEKALPCFRLDGLILVQISDFDEWLGQYRVGSQAEKIAKEILDKT